MKSILATALLVNLAAVTAVMAAEKCDVPVANWQPREALQTKLEADGWQVRSIKTEDGCYEAYAIDAAPLQKAPTPQPAIEKSRATSAGSARIDADLGDEAMQRAPCSVGGLVTDQGIALAFVAARHDRSLDEIAQQTAQPAFRAGRGQVQMGKEVHRAGR